jgi:hypothetical protein
MVNASGARNVCEMTGSESSGQWRLFLWAAAATRLCLACSGGGSAGPGFSPGEGQVVEKPGGGAFVADAHSGGQATRVHLLEMSWGRLVDVYDVDANGATNPLPVLRDVVVSESAVTGGAGFRFETSPVRHASRITILEPHDAPSTGGESFESILRRVTVGGPVLPRHDDGSALPPFSVVARDATLVVRFDDLLEDGPAARGDLHETVRLLSGYPPVTPQSARIVFDPSHGGIAAGKFHSTRVLIDFTVSGEEALSLPIFVPINPVGLPPSALSSPQPNVSVHLPVRTDEEGGQFPTLTNLAGRGLEATGPTDLGSGDVVRAFRSGSVDDVNGGRLLDLSQPHLVGNWDARIEDARADALGPTGRGFVVTLRFTTPCRTAAHARDALEIGGELYEVREEGPEPDGEGRLTGVRLLRLAEQPLSSAESLLGAVRFLTRFRPDEVNPACWITFSPGPESPPASGVDSHVTLRVRFSEPMEPGSFRAFDSFRMFRRSIADEQAISRNLVVGVVRPEQDLLEFDFIPRFPLANDSSVYRVELASGTKGVRDLAGTPLTGSFGSAIFELAAGQPVVRNGGLAMNFETELAPAGTTVFRGQAKLENGILRPRPVSFVTHHADQSHSIPRMMQTLGFGVQTPLSPLGSKLQALWRYADFGLQPLDERFFNLDVIGLYWSPEPGHATSDFYPAFEMRMAHARFLSDEIASPSGFGALYPLSGLVGAPAPFTDNILEDPRGGQIVVHPRQLGYRVNPADLTLTERGTPLMPFPWNRSGGPTTSFTWRDTSVLARGGPNGVGIPLDIESNPPLTGSAAKAGEVRTIGLPLLWEIRCYPSAQGLGQNPFAILLASPGLPNPNFRAFSTGGVDVTGSVVTVDPDLELVAQGGFNPSSFPAGRRTAFSADSAFYIGGIDTVVRLSRVVTIWMDTGSQSPRFAEPVVEPRVQIGSTSIVTEFRGADGFSADAGNAAFDAARLDPYGDPELGTVFFHGDGTWRADIRDLDGARFLQARFTFVNDVARELSPELDSFGVAFETP